MTTTATPSYFPRGAAKRLFECQSPEVLLSGPAGTGKSIASLTKLYMLAERIDGLRALIVRKTRESLTNSALVTFEAKVLPQNHACLSSGGQRRVRQSYRFANGSEIVLGGMDKSSKVLSTEYDIIYVQEAIELTEDDWETLSSRLRNGRLPYQQLLADTNPDRPTHWLKRRCDSGKTLMLESRHEDNPMLYDRSLSKFTAYGRQYLNRLDGLTGPRLARLRYGRWVQAEGVVYDRWDAAIHLIDRFPVPADWPRYWVFDFGFTNPLCWQQWVTDPDGRLYLCREIYATGLLVEAVAQKILNIHRAEVEKHKMDIASQMAKSAPHIVARATEEIDRQLRPKAIICDHDAEDRATLEKHLGMKTIAAHKAVSPGIQAVQSRLAKADDGKPRLFVMRDSLLARDPKLAESHRPCSTVEEFDGYVWGQDKEQPIKTQDHGMDNVRYMVAFLDVVTKRKFDIRF